MKERMITNCPTELLPERALLVTEAGGSISNLDGSPFDLRWSILAGNKAMHELIGKMIR